MIASLPEDVQEFIRTKLSSKFWRLNNLYTIEDKDGIKRVMKLNKSQRKVIRKYKHNKKIILKGRQQGISTLYLAYNLDSCIFTPGYSAGIQSYGLDESNKLQSRAQLMWDEFPEAIKNLLGILLLTNNSKGMGFNNRAILKIGNFRGDTLQSLHVSELGKIASKYPDKAEELKKGAFQAVSAKNKITIESTAEGRSGLFYTMWVTAKIAEKSGRDFNMLEFQPIFLGWLEDPDCVLYSEVILTEPEEVYIARIEKELDIELSDAQKWWYAAKKRELGDGFDQEYPATPEMAFEQSTEGTYYKEEYKNLRVEANIYDQNLLVHSAMDLGMNDKFSIGFFQKDYYGNIKIIGEYGNSGVGLDHYRDVYTALNKKLGWRFGKVYVPHDIKVRELIADKSRWDRLKELGFKPILVKRHRIQDGIEATREFLKRVTIDASCTEILTSIQSYRKKYDKKYSVYLDSPVHDEFSHDADMLRYMAMGDKHRPIKHEPTYYPRNNISFDI